MGKNIQCSSCSMMFSDETRLERHVKKAHPPKRKIEQNPSADFNHSYFPM